MSVFLILTKKSMLMLKMIKRKITREKNQHVVESKATGIKSSELIHSEILQETLEGKHGSSGWYSDSEPKF